MILIIDKTLDASGTATRYGPLPVVFHSRREAVTFLNGFLERSFPNGRSGYKAEEDYWWGCDSAFNAEVHHYRIEERSPGS